MRSLHKTENGPRTVTDVIVRLIFLEGDFDACRVYQSV